MQKFENKLATLKSEDTFDPSTHPLVMELHRRCVCVCVCVCVVKRIKCHDYL